MKALITGASSGIGKDFAKILSNQYDELILVARDKKKLEEVKKEIENKSTSKVTIVDMDLSISSNCKKIFDKFKNIDLLINDAGFGDCGYFEKTDLDKDISMINTNVTALHILTKLYLKEMLKSNKGHILNVASIAAFVPGPLMATYYSTKAYVLKLSESIKEELKHKNTNVKISVLCPGPVKTNFEKNANVEFQVSKADSYKVADYAVKHLNRFYICPGFSVKLTRLLSKIIPSSLIAKFIYKIQKKRIR
jgi:short-subunit dehydrogenase